MNDINMKQCSVIMEPLTHKLKPCNVVIDQWSPKSKIVNNINKNKLMLPPVTPHLKKCYVALEPCTPKTEPALTAELRKAINEKNILTTKTKTKFIDALNELEATNDEHNRKCKKDQAIQEILNSEIAYLKQLNVILTYFKKPLTEKKILPYEDIQKLFGDISTIHNVNQELLSKLIDNPQNASEAFLKIAPFFKLYSTYAYDYKMILDILKDNEKHNEEFRKFLNNQESRPEVQAKLVSLLITPIQRIPRYCLLLKQILHYTLPSEHDYETLKESLKVVEESARHTDKLVQERENSERLLEIQNCLQNNKPLIIKPGRNIIKEGLVVRTMNSESSQLYLIAMTDILMFCKIKKDNLKLKNSLRCTCILPINKCKVRQNPVCRTIEIRCVNEIFNLYIDKQNEFDDWIRILKTSVVNYIHNRKTLRKESSSRRPAYRKDLNDYSDVGVSPGRLQRKRKVAESVIILNTEFKTHPRYDSSLITKRKCIRDIDDDNMSKVSNSEMVDSLFPLRRHYISSSKEDLSNSYRKNEDLHHEHSFIGNVAEKDLSQSDKVFVFGKEDNPYRGFNFKFINFFTNIGKSFKKVFGFK